MELYLPPPPPPYPSLNVHMEFALALEHGFISPLPKPNKTKLENSK